MTTTKKVKVRVKKAKIKVLNVLLFSLILIIIILTSYYFITCPIKNIYILNNNHIKDKEIIEISKLSNYPSFILSFESNIKKRLLKNKLIKDVKVTKKFIGKIYIDIEEYKIVCLTTDNNLLLENGSKIENTFNFSEYPLLLNDVTNIYDDFIEKFSQIDSDVLLKISEIEYIPNEVDKQRFLLTMNDGNYVYITLTKIKKINKYSSIASEMENRTGTIYLDSGDYVDLD